MAGLLAGLAACGGAASSREPDAEPASLDPVTSEVPENAPGMAQGAPLSPCSADGVFSGSVRVLGQADLERLRGCQRISGDLSIELFEGLDPAPLSSLRVVEGLAAVFGNYRRLPAPMLERPLDVLSSLEEAGGLQLFGVPSPNLDALARLQRLGKASLDDVSYPIQLGLWIDSCPGLTSLEGLNGLVRVAKIQLHRNPDLVSLRGLDALREVDVLDVFATPLRDLEGFPAASLRVLSLNDTALESLAGLGDATSLEQLELTRNPQLLRLEGATFGEPLWRVAVRDNPALASVSGLAGVRKLLIFEIASSPSLVTLAGLEPLEEVGTLNLTGLGIANLTGLGGLARAESIYLSNTPQLADLTGLSALRELGSLSVTGAPGFVRATGLGGLTLEQLSLNDVGLPDLTGLEQLQITAALSVDSSPGFTSLNGLPALGDQVSLRLSNLPALADTSALARQTALFDLLLSGTGVAVLSGLGQLQRLRNLGLTNNANLTELEPSPALRELGTLQIDQNPLLRSLPAWPGVEGTGCADCEPFALQIWNNAALETGPELPGLERAGFVAIANNPSLREVSGLRGLRSVSALHLVNNAALTSVALPALQEAGGLDIHGNAVLEEALVLPLEEQLSSSGTIQILSNGSGPALMSPCPWSGDGFCDEGSGACAPRTDGQDCL